MKKAFIVAITIVLILSLATAATATSKEWASYEVDSGVMDLKEGYEAGWKSFYHVVENPGVDERYASLRALLVAETDLSKAELLAMTNAQVRDAAHDAGIVYYKTEIEGLTDQIWAAQVEAKPGEAGMLSQEFEAAYGNTYAGLVDDKDDLHDDQWGFVEDGDLHIGYAPVRGEDYVGNYFHIDQHAMTTDGTLKRFIDISSPFDGSYLHEDFEVTGQADVQEAFEMTNIKAGEAIEVVWYDLF